MIRVIPSGRLMELMTACPMKRLKCEVSTPCDRDATTRTTTQTITAIRRAGRVLMMDGRHYAAALLAVD
jgi:hypothetical protein